jgi:O-methyltransferase involved in polyketide biosynthesis
VLDDWKHDATRRAKAALIDTSVPNAARVWDYLSGGRNNFEADRKAARTMAAASVMGATAVAARAFQRRAVRYLVAEAGVRQFLDIGAGLAMAGSTHEAAQALVPECRVVYVDNDPVVLSHARALLRSAPGGAIDYLDSDVRDAAGIVSAARSTLDFGQPVAILLVTMLAFVPGAEAAAAVAALAEAVPPGSYVVLSHLASDADYGVRAAVRQWNSMSDQRLTLRSRAEVAGLVAGLDPVPPGLVPVSAWRPDAVPGDLAPQPADVPMYGVVARKCT